MPRREISQKLTFSEALKDALIIAMEQDKRVFIIGEGAPDPKGIFGTTIGLREKFGKHRVMDMPVSENAVTGIIVGAALVGMRPVMTHQRMDFMLYSMDQLVNSAAKWRSMFGQQQSVPIVIRAIVGQGWGQGAQHSQNLHVLFGHIPGLKVVAPASAYEAKGLLLASIADDNPVIFIEHRWLHNTTSDVPSEYYELPLGKAKKITEGDDITLVTHSYMVLEAIKAQKILLKKGLSVEIINLLSIKPLDVDTVLASVEKTKRLIVIDLAWKTYGLAAEVICSIMEKGPKLLSPPKRITLPDAYAPSSPQLSRYYYPNYRTIAREISSMFGRKSDSKDIASDFEGIVHADVPDKSFTGPF